MAGARSSIGVDLDPTLNAAAFERALGAKTSLNDHTLRRLLKHKTFAEERQEREGIMKHRNIHYDFPVVTGQEKDLLLPLIRGIFATGKDGEIGVTYDSEEK